MTDGSKFEQMAKLLDSDEDTRKRLLRDPDGTFRAEGLDKSLLDRRIDTEALARGQKILKSAGLRETDTMGESLKKLGAAAEGAFGRAYEVRVEPLGITLLEQITNPSLEVTGTGTVRCTTSSWDGCSADVDG